MELLSQLFLFEKLHELLLVHTPIVVFKGFHAQSLLVEAEPVLFYQRHECLDKDGFKGVFFSLVFPLDELDGGLFDEDVVHPAVDLAL